MEKRTILREVSQNCNCEITLSTFSTIFKSFESQDFLNFCKVHNLKATANSNRVIFTLLKAVDFNPSSNDQYHHLLKDFENDD